MLVQGTNDSSIVSKRSMVERGYFKDDFIKFFSQKSSRRSPLINIGYYVRACVMDCTLSRFCRSMRENKFQVFSLGAGFDSTYFRKFARLKNVKYFEVDLEEVVHKKTEIILKNEELLKIVGKYEVLGNSVGILSENYVLFSQNLYFIKDLDEMLNKLGIDYSLPTIIFSECAITYMEESKCTELIMFLANKFTESVMMTYEQIQPDDGFGAVMMKHFDSIQNPLKSVLKYKTLEDRKKQYEKCGWSNSESICVYNLFTSYLNPVELKDKVNIEPFDEWEEWHLKCCHYGLTLASNGKVFSEPFKYFTNLQQELNNNPEIKREILNWAIENDGPLIERFGHSSVEIDKGVYALVGGFGLLPNGKHSRLSDIKLVTPRRVIGHYPPTEGKDGIITWESCHHSCTPVGKGKFIMYGGRKSPSAPVNVDPCLVELASADDVLSCQPRVRVEPLSLLGEKPCARWRHTLVQICRKFYLFGGRDDRLNVLGDLWVLDIDSGWTFMGEDKSKGRFSHSCVSYDGQLVIIGGLNFQFSPLSDVWVYNTREDKWKEVNVSGLIARYSHTAHVISNSLILVGGVNCSHSSQPGICILDLKSFNCVEYSLPVSSPEMPILFHNHCSIIAGDDEGKAEIIVLGGGGNCFSFGTSFNKTPIKIPLDQFYLF